MGCIGQQWSKCINIYIYEIGLKYPDKQSNKSLIGFENDYFKEKQKKNMFENNSKTENKTQELFLAVL